MGKTSKAIERLLSRPKDYTYEELKSLLSKLGYEEKKRGKSSGSRVAFYNPSNNNLIRLHKPHPGNIIKRYTIDAVIDSLKRNEEI